MDDDFIAFDAPGSAGSSSSSSKKPAKVMTDGDVPWLDGAHDGTATDTSISPLVRLHNEILTFCEYITPTKGEARQRDMVLAETTQIIKSIWPTAKVKVFGSQKTRILTPWSDLDLAVLDVPQGETETIADLLEKLGAAILAKNNVTYCEVISSAKVPIVKFDHKSGPASISVDICLNNDSGVHTGSFLKQMVKTYPPLRPLTMLLKVFLAQRRLNETYSGGIGSFVLSCMIVSFLQQRVRLAKFRRAALSWTLGSLLIDFLHLYGSTFNYVHTGISITCNGSYFEKRARQGGEWANASRPNLLSIENPYSDPLEQRADEGPTDMGRNSFQFPKIRRALEHALQLLSAALADPGAQSYLSFFIRKDDPLLQARPTVSPFSQLGAQLGLGLGVGGAGSKAKGRGKGKDGSSGGADADAADGDSDDEAQGQGQGREQEGHEDDMYTEDPPDSRLLEGGSSSSSSSGRGSASQKRGRQEEDEEDGEVEEQSSKRLRGQSGEEDDGENESDSEKGVFYKDAMR